MTLLKNVLMATETSCARSDALISTSLSLRCTPRRIDTIRRERGAFDLADEINQKDKLTALIELMKLAWSSFDRRRDFEWKVALGLWTSLVAFIAIVLTRQVIDNVAVPIGTTVGAIAIVTLHYHFSQGLGNANNADRSLFFFYEKQVQGMIGVAVPDDVKAAFSSLRASMGLVRNWSHIFQIGVTLLLGAGCVGAVWAAYLTSAPAVGP